MTTNTLVLKVPPNEKVRTEIRKTVDKYFSENDAFPPISMENLQNFALRLMQTNNWDAGYQAFVIVCCGNAVWRKIVGTVPYNRRIFLLPQCLKSSLYCSAEMDNIGLLCNECGKCTISAFLREAENLGYLALVTEGTTITTKLIESGKVDAVIGVGCMEVLQKMFASVSKFSIPGIGIPLLNCGCIDTSADMAWIKEEIHYYVPQPEIKILNLNHLRSITSSVFGREQLERYLGPAQTETEQLIMESLLAGGQRIRPFLAVLTYEAFCQNPEKSEISRLSLIVECFHKASLIHDDIEDNDSHRYGKETIHSRFGVPIAINAGDLLIGEGYRLLSECTIEPQNLGKCLQIIARGHRALTIGQGTELLAIKEKKILPFQDLLNVFENKTAAAFRVSFLLGAAMGGANDHDIEILDTFSHFIGLAYQIKDDIEDYSGEQNDIEFRKSSFMLTVLYEQLSSDEREKIQEEIQNGNNLFVYQCFENYNTKTLAIDFLLENVSNAKLRINQLSNPGLKLALHEILGKIFKDYL
jgi:geranylgeranyl diphosphate synthase, type II